MFGVRDAKYWPAASESFVRILRVQDARRSRVNCPSTVLWPTWPPLLGTLNISSAHVVGYSLATMVCQRLAVNYPERANSLVSPSQHVRVGLLERARNVPMNGITSDRAIDSNQGGHQSESRCVPAGEHNAAGYARTCGAPARAMPALPMRIRRHRRRKVVFWRRRSLCTYLSKPCRAYDSARKASGGESSPIELLSR
jgi:hypothetical protein